MYISDIVHENVLSVVFFEYSTLSGKEVDINFRNNCVIEAIIKIE